eukprot:2794083-Prymnesium_polylepis.1
MDHGMDGVRVRGSGWARSAQKAEDSGWARTSARLSEDRTHSGWARAYRGSAARRPRGHAAAGVLRHLAAERLRLAGNAGLNFRQELHDCGVICEFISLPGAARAYSQAVHLSSVARVCRESCFRRYTDRVKI